MDSPSQTSQSTAPGEAEKPEGLAPERSSEQPPGSGPGQKSPWLLRTPLVALGTAVGMIVIHGMLVLSAGYLVGISNLCAALTDVCFEFASVPVRFYAEPGSMYAYPNILAQGFSLVTPALLHANWIHVLTNALMTWQFGSMVAMALGPGIRPAAQWMLLFVVSVAAGSIAFLAIVGPEGPVSVGASGGTSGLIAAGFLLDWEGRVRSPFSRQFLMLTGMFALINVLLVLAGPMLVGMAISWEAHAGGYVAGAAMMLIFGRKMQRAPAA